MTLGTIEVENQIEIIFNQNSIKHSTKLYLHDNYGDSKKFKNILFTFIFFSIPTVSLRYLVTETGTRFPSLEHAVCRNPSRRL